MIEAKVITTKPGIYCFKNLINGKCYIGQAINLQKRFKAHISNFKAERFSNPLYKAFKKYTIENFEYIILQTLDNIDKSELDTLEIKYIKEYNSYKEGYNQTLGGDYGVLGYKFTNLQKELQKENTLKRARDGRYKIIIYDIETNIYYTFINMSVASEIMNFKASSLRSAKCHKRLYQNRYYISNSVEDIEILKNNKKSDNKYSKSGSEELYKEYWKYLNQFTSITIDKISKDLNIGKDAIMKRNQKLRKMGYELNMIVRK